jgi:hypothetical protein
MRLLNANTYEVREFFSNIPRYAILSHTWSEESKDEISYQDIGNLDQARQKAHAFSKIEWCAHYAISKSLQWIWVDTCCIDKSSTTELSEAIISMYKWYEEADTCFVYLEGVGPGQNNLTTARWFTRGWTLQELLAPRKMEFFNGSWDHIGTRDRLKDPIARATGIPRDVISKQRSHSLISADVKFSWAANRETTRPEDWVYSLCGIFDVSMGPLYGEGKTRAFNRLMEEINKPRHSFPSLFNTASTSNTTGNPTPWKQGNAKAGGYSNMQGNAKVGNPIKPNVTKPGRPQMARPANSMKGKTNAYTADSDPDSFPEDDSTDDESTAFPNILPTNQNIRGKSKTKPGGGYQTGGYQTEEYQMEGFQPGGFQPGGFQPGGFQSGGNVTRQFPGYLNSPEPERKRSPLQRLGMDTGANSKGNEWNKKKQKQMQKEMQMHKEMQKQVLNRASSSMVDYEEYEYESS